MNSFNWKQYTLNYPDLKHLKTKYAAVRHFINFGQYEERTDSQDKEQVMITVITPCIRPDNLILLKESMDFNKVCEWIIVYDQLKIPFQKNLFEDNEKISEYHFGNSDGISGNPQRNFALNLVKNKFSYIYYLDDDNIIHPVLYKLSLLKNKIYTFNQITKENKLRLKGNNIKPDYIDSAMFLVYYPLVKDILWILDKYNADGYYIEQCYLNNIDKWIYVDKNFCYYNFLTN
jgi:hypothetical protein